jgi:hypothetical protein
MNRAISAAASLGPQTVGTIADGSLEVQPGGDIGNADYVRMAFAAFGPRIESMYYLYFLVLSLATLLFIVAFRNNPAALLIGVFIVFAYYLEPETGAFSPDSPTFSSFRHVGVLG